LHPQIFKSCIISIKIFREFSKNNYLYHIIYIRIVISINNSEFIFLYIFKKLIFYYGKYYHYILKISLTIFIFFQIKKIDLSPFYFYTFLYFSFIFIMLCYTFGIFLNLINKYRFINKIYKKYKIYREKMFPNI